MNVFHAFRLPLSSLQCGRLLQHITNTKCYQNGLQLHAHMLSSGVLLSNTYLFTKLAAMYAICGSLIEARTLFDGIALKSSFLWNTMVRGYACNGYPLASIALYRKMIRSDRRPDNFTYPFVLMACGDLWLVEIGRRIHCEIIVNGYSSDVYVGNSLVSMYSKFKEIGVARKVFDDMPERDLTSWNMVVSGYTKNGDPGRATSVFAAMVESGEKVDRVTLLAVLPACADLEALKQVKEIHASILRGSIEFDGYLKNALINVYANSKYMKGARSLFEDMTSRDTVSWNSMISGCSRNGDAVESLNLLCQMNAEGFILDDITLVAVLGACDRLAALQSGKSIHAYVTRKGFYNCVTVGTALVDMYDKCGSLGCSRQVFDEMPVKTLVSWSAMISGYGLHGRGKEAVAYFSEMKLKGVRADHVTFTSVLSACSHSGLVDEGKRIFHQMLNEYSMKPNLDHYSCMVDLLGRAGHLDEAYKFIMNMELEPSVDVWAALLSACRIHRNVELAEIAANNAFNLKPKCVGVYVSLSNIYALEKRWSDVERVRAAARCSGLRKPPGCSFVELGMTIHKFMVGDKSHPQSKFIYTKLSELRQELKEAGYVPDTSSVFYDVVENVKENMLWDHSERLAIAFALLNTCQGATVRITKNLRVCSDCHTVTKLLSKLVDRDIIVRDAHRFHHFHNGSCSCSDYW